MPRICAGIGGRNVSIHAPHEGERPRGENIKIGGQMFQSTLPTRGSDVKAVQDGKPTEWFQSTLPTRGSDRDCVYARPIKKLFQSTLPTRGSDGLQSPPSASKGRVSIHAPHEGERLICTANTSKRVEFQSTLPTRGSDFLHQPANYIY